MAIVTIGRPAYFFVLFVDEDQNPVSVVGTTIHLFTFDEDAELVLEDGVMTPTNEVGKFMYSFMIPEDWSYDSNLYAHMRGTDDKGLKYLTEQQFDLWNEDGTPYRKPPPPPPMSHWNTDDGGNGADGFASNTDLAFQTARVPTADGADGNLVLSEAWGNTTQDRVTKTGVVEIDTVGHTTGFGGDSQFVVRIESLNQVYEEVVFPATGDISQFSPSSVIHFTITDFQDDNQDRKKAFAKVVLDLDMLVNSVGRWGSVFRVTTTHITDTVSDGGGSYSHTINTFYYDSNPETPSFDQVLFEENLRVVRHLSGIAYYTNDTVFRVTVKDINHLNNASAKASKNLTVEAVNIDLPKLEHSPFGVGAGYFSSWDSKVNRNFVDYQKNDWKVQEPNYRVIDQNIYVQAHADDTWNNGVTKISPSLPVLIDTYEQTSTPQYDGFDDEIHRTESDYVTVWDSLNHLNSGQALVQGGFLQIPHTDWSPYLPLDPLPNPDYTGIGQGASYYRTFEATDDGTISHSNLEMSIFGQFVNGLEQDLINGDLQIFIRKKVSESGASGVNSPPLMVHGTAYNHTLFDDGVTNGQIREFVVGNTLSVTFGGYAVKEGVYMEIRITNPLVKIDSMSVSF